MFQGKITKKGFKKRNPLGCRREADLDLNFLVDSNPDPCRHRTVDKQNEKKCTVKNIKILLTDKCNIFLYLTHQVGLPGHENLE
jgi:hypothetical protein